MDAKIFDPVPVLDLLRLLGEKFLKKFKLAPVPPDAPSMIRMFQEIENESLVFTKSKLGTAIPFADGELDAEKQKTPPDFPACWIFDSMDGAVQYMRHLPGWTFNIALVLKQELHFAAVFDPLHGEMFWAERGRGAFLNGIPVKCAARDLSGVMMAATSHPPFPGKSAGLSLRISECDKKLLDTYSFLRNFGPTALQLAYVAAGRVDVFAQQGLDTFNWVPGILIAREAGAAVLDSKGEIWKWGDESLLVAERNVADYYLRGQTPK